MHCGHNDQTNLTCDYTVRFKVYESTTLLNKYFVVQQRWRGTQVVQAPEQYNDVTVHVAVPLSIVSSHDATRKPQASLATSEQARSLMQDGNRQWHLSPSY